MPLNRNLLPPSKGALDSPLPTVGFRFLITRNPRAGGASSRRDAKPWQDPAVQDQPGQYKSDEDQKVVHGVTRDG